MVEKPKPEDAPSTLAVVGRYILSGAVFDRLQHVQPGSGGEIQLTDGIVALLADEPVLAYRFDGVRYDCGSKIGYLKASVELGLKHPEVGAEFGDYLRGYAASR
jgi:UTP--glucose-1-phosphate uridylyltransferase